MIVRSWIAEYWSTTDALLLGAVRRGRSSRWGSKALAEAYLAVALANNAHANPEGRAIPSQLYPEIFVHCGRHHQVISGKCPGCGKKLTLADAIEHGDAHAVAADD
jgi:hypothetical protein